jgi:hypothetical protein
VKVGAGVPDQVPDEAVSCCPVTAAPDVVGSDTLTGAAGVEEADWITPVGAESTGPPVPLAFVALSATRIVWPWSIGAKT